MTTAHHGSATCAGAIPLDSAWSLQLPSVKTLMENGGNTLDVPQGKNEAGLIDAGHPMCCFEWCLLYRMQRVPTVPHDAPIPGEEPLPPPVDEPVPEDPVPHPNPVIRIAEPKLDLH